MKLSKRIREARDALDMSQVDLAEKLGVAPSTVAAWELDDEHRPRIDRLGDIAAALKLEKRVLVADYLSELVA